MAQKAKKYTPPAASMQRSSNTIWMPVEQESPTQEGWDLTDKATGLLELNVAVNMGEPDNDFFQLRADDLRDETAYRHRIQSAARKLANNVELKVANMGCRDGVIGYHFAGCNRHQYRRRMELCGRCRRTDNLSLGSSLKLLLHSSRTAAKTLAQMLSYSLKGDEQTHKQRMDISQHPAIAETKSTFRQCSRDTSIRELIMEPTTEIQATEDLTLSGDHAAASADSLVVDNANDNAGQEEGFEIVLKDDETAPNKTRQRTRRIRPPPHRAQTTARA